MAGLPVSAEESVVAAAGSVFGVAEVIAVAVAAAAVLEPKLQFE